MGIFANGIKKTNLGFFQKLGRVFTSKSKIDDNILDALEEALLGCDMGVDTTLKLIDNIQDRVEKDKYVNLEELTALIRDEISNLMGDDAPVVPFDFSKKPYVILVVGVNGVGKTTTIGKIAAMLRAQGKKVVILDDVISTGGSLKALESLAQKAGGEVICKAAVLAEGDAAQRTDIVFLEKLPLFDAE